MYCKNCGKEVAGMPSFCTQCGAPIDKSTMISTKSRLAVTLLAIIPGYFGIAGIHRFYLGKIGTGIAMLLTIGGFGIWTLIDFIFAVAGIMKDKEGKLIKTW